MIESGEDPASKAEWRSRLLAARRRVPAGVRVSEANALATSVVTVPGSIVCCYLPVGTEPGSLSLLTTLDADGRRVLLPVVAGEGPLDWAAYEGEDRLTPGPFGLHEPLGPRLGPDAISIADAVLVPALAIDRRGVRLGRGGGHYDRSLPLAHQATELVAVVRDEELVRRLPSEPHDVRVTSVLTPRRGLLPVPWTEPAA